MELKPGYKLTEVGVIPEDWDAGNLGRFWSVTDCKHLTAEFVSSGIPIASIREVQSRFVDLTNAKQTTLRFYNLLIEGGRKPQPGDLILSRNATVGEVAQVADWHPRFAMGQDVCLLRKKSLEFSTEFLQAVFQSPIIGAQLSNLMVGSTFKRANIEQIRNFAVPMPPPEEQRAIASALSDMDELLGACDRLIAKKRDLKQAAMQQLLTGKTRLPGFGKGKGYKQSEIGTIPEDWDIRQLENLGTRTIPPIKAGPFGSVLTKDTYVSTGYKVYGQEQVIRGDYLYGNYFILTEKFRQLESCAVKTGDILLSLVGTAGKVLVIPENAPPGIINPRLIRLSFDKELVDSHFFRELFESGEIQSFLSRYAQGGTMGVLNAGTLKSVSIGLPSIEEQRAIATVLSEMDAEIAALEQRRDKTRALKQAMMQELLTGRIRLI